ncbi:TPA: helix-turn-helix transcriptional regulator [Photobacterium damselae]
MKSYRNLTLIGRKVKELRLIKQRESRVAGGSFNYSAAQVAKKLEIGRQTYIDLEACVRPPSLALILSVCELFDVGLDYFIDDKYLRSSKEEVIKNITSDEIINALSIKLGVKNKHSR